MSRLSLCLPVQDTPLSSLDGAVQLIMQGDGNVVLYNSTKVQLVGYNAASAIWASGTYTSSPKSPYSLIMQMVTATEPAWG